VGQLQPLPQKPPPQKHPGAPLTCSFHSPTPRPSLLLLRKIARDTKLALCLREYTCSTLLLATTPAHLKHHSKAKGGPHSPCKTKRETPHWVAAGFFALRHRPGPQLLLQPASHGSPCPSHLRCPYPRFTSCLAPSKLKNKSKPKI